MLNELIYCRKSSIPCTLGGNVETPPCVSNMDRRRITRILSTLIGPLGALPWICSQAYNSWKMTGNIFPLILCLTLTLWFFLKRMLDFFRCISLILFPNFCIFDDLNGNPWRFHSSVLVLIWFFNFLVLKWNRFKSFWKSL